MNKHIKIKILLCFVLFFYASMGAMSRVQADIREMSPGQWYSIPGSQLSSASVYPSPLPPGVEGASAVIDSWSGGTYDSVGKRLLIWGGGHAAYSGNEIYAFDLDPDSPAAFSWSRIWGPTDNSDIPTDNNSHHAYLDGNPGSRHTYFGVAFDPNTGAYGTFYGAGGAIWKTGHVSSRVWTFDIASGVWTDRGALPTTTGNYGWVSVYNSNNGYIYTRNRQRIYKYDPADGTHTEVYNHSSHPDSVWGDDNAGVYDPDNNLIVYFNSDGEVDIFNITANTYSTNVTTSGTKPDFTRSGATYDTINKEILVYQPYWTSLTDVFAFDARTLAWTKTTGTAAEGSSVPSVTYGTGDGLYGRWAYVPHLGGVVMVPKANAPVYFYKTSHDSLQTVVLTSDQTNPDTPFTVGLGFKKGDTVNPTLSLDNYQIKIMRTWNDGSIKHAIASGRYASRADTPKKITVYKNGTQPSGTDLTETDIITASPAASVAFDNGWTTVELSALLGTPDRTFVSGPEMVEAHYSQDVIEEGDVNVKFYVRLYSNGNIWIRVGVENGVLDGEERTHKSYTPTITIGGVSKYNSAITHLANSRYSVDGWIGVTDPNIKIKQDVAYLKESKLVPNYWKDGPSDSVLNALGRSYMPMQRVNWTRKMADAGYQPQIGLLPNWEALYINSGGDSRAFDAVIASAKSLNSYPIIWRDPVTDRPIVLSSWSNWTYEGANQGGATKLKSGPLEWDVAHHPSGGYLAYLVTGDYYHLETMMHQAATCYLVAQSSHGSGTSRLMFGQTRGVAWIKRTTGQLAAIAPIEDPIVSDFISRLDYNINYYNDIRQQDGQNEIGFLYNNEVRTGIHGTGWASQWQQAFWTMTYGHLSDIEPLPDMTNLYLVRDFSYKSAVGIFGPNGVDYFCFNDANRYTIKISDTATGDPRNFYDSWGTVYYETFGVYNDSCGNTLEGNLSPTYYYANQLPAIAYAVEHGAEGAAEAWSRLTGASNWSTFENGGFEDTPVWGIYPRRSPFTTGEDTDMQGIILTAAAPDITISGGTAAFVYGTTAPNRITLESGAYAELVNFPGQNLIEIQSIAWLFEVYRSGAVVIFQGSDGTMLKIPATKDEQIILFDGKSPMLLQIQKNKVMLNDQIITTSPLAVEIILLNGNANDESGNGNNGVLGDVPLACVSCFIC